MSHSYLTDLSRGIVPVAPARRDCASKKGMFMTDRPFNVLFLCTDNSAHSIMAEGSSTIWARGNLGLYGSDAEIALGFKNADRMLPQHVGPFRALPIHALDKLSLQAKLKAIGEIEGATKLKEPA
jgi:hypothetical protein